MKTVCVYHSIDLDGWMSAAIVKHWHESIMKSQENITGQSQKEYNQINFIGYNYGQPVPDLSEYDEVIMCDISFPIEEMEKLNDKLVYIDHHISAIKDFNNSEIMSCDGLRDVSFAACELTWKYFFPNESMPEIVKLLGRYDCFGHKGTDEEHKVLEFQYGARQVISNYEEAYYYLKQELIRQEGNVMVPTNSTWEYIHNQGKVIYQYLCTEAKQIYNKAFPIKLGYKPGGRIEADPRKYDSYNFLCINKERFNPINFGIDYHKDGYDGIACFWYANGMWNFSLYNDNGEVNCSQIAKRYGGGGHKGAAGFVINSLESIIK